MPAPAVLWSAALAGLSAAPAFAAGVVAQLSPLPPLAQIGRLHELSAADPAARLIAAAIARPDLIALHAAQLRARLGAEETSALTLRAAELQIEARGDGRVMEALEVLGRQLAADGRLDSLDPAPWFDGAAAGLPEPGGPAAGEGRLSAALVWPVHGAAEEPSVHTLTARDGQFLINGKRAARLREARTQGDVVSETLLHPGDPGVLVKVHHSPASLEGFRANLERVETLAPLSEAGAAPRLIEHGEAPVAGKGRIYFYSQERVQGTRLRDLPPRERPLDEVRRLFDRLAQAGLALIVPGPGQDWLLSHIMVGQTPSGGARAYVLGGSVERGRPEELAAHYRMLLSVLVPDETGDAVPSMEKSRSEAVAAFGRLATIEGGKTNELAVVSVRSELLAGILRRHGLESATATLADGRDPAAAAAALLSDPDVARIQVAPAVRDDLERFGVKPLERLLRMIPEGVERDALIAKIPGAAYLKTESSAIASLLAAVSASDRAGAVYSRVPDEAWRAMRQAEILYLAELWLNRAGAVGGARHTADVLLRRWLAVHEGRPGEPVGQEIADVLQLVSSEQRRAAVMSLPPLAYSRMSSGEAARILSEGKSGTKDEQLQFFKEAPKEAWRALTGAHLSGLQALFNKNAATSDAILLGWIGAGGHELETDDLAGLVKKLSGKEPQSEAVRKMPIEAYLKMSSQALASFLFNHGWPEVLPEVPKAAWRRLLWAEIEWLSGKAGDLDWLRAVVGYWFDAAEGQWEPAGLTAEGFLRWARTLSAKSDAAKAREILVRISAPAHALLDSKQMGEVLSLLSDHASVPETVWRRLELPELERLMDQWKSNRPEAGLMARSWVDAHRSQLGGAGATGDDLARIINALAAQPERDALILKIPGQAYAKMRSAEVFEILRLLTGDQYNSVPREAWLRLRPADKDAFKALWGTNAKYADWIELLWNSIHQTQGAKGKDLLAMLRGLTPSKERDRLISELSEDDFKLMGSAEIASALGLVSHVNSWWRLDDLSKERQRVAEFYRAVPSVAWERLEREDAERLVGTWAGRGYDAAAQAILELWMAAHHS